MSREVRAADAGKKDAGAQKGKKRCNGKKCQKRLLSNNKGTKKEKERQKCKKGKNCKRRNKTKVRKAKVKKAKGRKEKKGGKGKNRKGGKGKNGKLGKGRNKKGEKGKRNKPRRMNIKFRNSGKQNGTFPAKCKANTCTPTDNVNLFNTYKKVILIRYGLIMFFVSLQNDNMLRQLQRLVRFYDLIKKKSVSALSTFEAAAELISNATSGCSTCA